jgi:hypothetical protein
LKIVDYRIVPEAELLQRLQQTRLRGYDRAQVDRDATLELCRGVDPETLAPAQRYVLSGGVRTIVDLRAAFAPFGIDVFDLPGAVLFTSDESRDPVPLLPPVVEESIERDGRKVLIVNDGLHRVFAARKLGQPITVVLARNVPPEYPYYAYALPDGWNGVKEIEQLPDDFQKKEYRLPDNYKALFRDFNEVFAGVQQQRKQSNPAHLSA